MFIKRAPWALLALAGRGGSRILIARADGTGTPRLLTGNLEGNDQFDPSWGR